MSRRKGREGAVELLFSYSFNGDVSPEEIYALACENGDNPPDEFAKALFFKTVENIADIDARISAAADSWRIERISRVALTVLRLCCCEVLYTEDFREDKNIPINEMLELARLYSDEQTVSFCNGVIGKIVN